MAITLGNVTSSGPAGTTTNYSFSHNNNGDVLAIAISWSGSPSAPTAVTYNGSACTQAAIANAQFRKAAIYYHASPDSGSNTFNITFSANSYVDVTIYSLIGADTSTVIGESGNNSGSGSSGTSTITKTTSADSIFIDAFSIFGTHDSVGAGQTLQRDVTVIGVIDFTSSYKNGLSAGSNSMSNTYTTTNNWGHAAAEFLVGSSIIEKNVTDNIDVGITALKSLYRSFSNAISITESIAVLVIIEKIITEFINISESVSRNFTKTLSNTVNILSNSTKVLSRSLSNSITISESVLKSLSKSFVEGVRFIISVTYFKVIKITFNNASGSNINISGATNPQTATKSYTNSATFMCVGISAEIADGYNVTITDVQYNGVSLTQLQDSTGLWYDASIWYLADPDIGTYNLTYVITRSSTAQTAATHVDIATFDNVYISDPIKDNGQTQYTSNTNTETTPSFTTDDGGAAYSFCFTRGVTPTPAAGQTTTSSGNNAVGSYELYATGTTDTHSFTNSTTNKANAFVVSLVPRLNFIEKILTESIKVSSSILRSFSRTITSSINFTETVNKVILIIKMVTDSIQMTENIVRSFSRSFSDAVITTSTSFKQLVRSFIDFVRVSDSISTIRSLSKVVTESIYVAESIIRKLNGIFIDIWTKTAKIATSWTESDKISTTWAKTAKVVSTWTETAKNSSTWTKIAKISTNWTKTPKT